MIRKEEEKWWLARNNTGREGMIPATYVEVVSNVLIISFPWQMHTVFPLKEDWSYIVFIDLKWGSCIREDLILQQ